MAAKCKVIFLDIDGVLNCEEYFKKTEGFEVDPPDDAIEARREKLEKEEGPRVLSIEWWGEAIDPEAIKLLNELIERTDARVVISSSWRLNTNIGYLRKVLGLRGFKGTIIGATPRLVGDNRGEEISSWLRVHGSDIDSFVILDDEDIQGRVRSRHIQTSFKNGGLLREHVEKAVNMLR